MSAISRINPEDGMSENGIYAVRYAQEKNWHILPCWWIKVIDNVRQCACPHGRNCKNPGKHPLFELVPHGHKSASNDPAVIASWWKKFPDANPALALMISGLIAIDVDPRNGGDVTFEELERKYGKITSDVMQLTGGGGFHLVLAIDFVANLPGRLGPGIDLKHDGYILLPPSNHLSGGAYAWEGSSSPLEGNIPSVIPSWLRGMASSSVKEDECAPVPVQVATLDDRTADDLLKALPFIDSNDRDTWLSVGMALHSTGDGRAYQWWMDWSATSPKFDGRDQVRVWRSFKGRGLSGVSLPTVFHMAQLGGWVNVPGMPAVTVCDELPDMPPPSAPVADVPAHLLDIPVRQLREVMTWMEGFTREPQRQISIQGALALGSVLCGRIYCSTESNTSALYLVTLAGTGVGKNYIKSAVQQFLAEAGLPQLLSGSGNTSAGAVFSALMDSPTHIQITDEIGKHLQAARRQVSGQMAEAFTALTEAYSSTTGVMVPKNYSSISMSPEMRKAMPKRIVYNPSITLLGLATPGQVYENISSREIEDGFLNRLIVVEATLPQEERRQSRRAPVPDALKEWATKIRKPTLSGTTMTGQDTAYDQVPAPVTVEFAHGVLEMFDAWHEDLRRREKAGEFVEPELTRRYVENAMRLGTLLAVCAYPATPVITAELARWAIDYVGWYGERFMLSVASQVADSDFHRLKKQVLETVINRGPRGATERELAQYSRLFAATPPTQRDQALTALARESAIQQMTFKPVSGRGKPRAAWVSCDLVEDENHD